MCVPLAEDSSVFLTKVHPNNGIAASNNSSANNNNRTSDDSSTNEDNDNDNDNDDNNSKNNNNNDDNGEDDSDMMQVENNLKKYSTLLFENLESFASAKFQVEINAGDEEGDVVSGRTTCHNDKVTHITSSHHQHIISHHSS